MTAIGSRRVLRYHLVQRLLHWMGAAGFLLLFVTGSILVWTPHVPIGTCCATRQLHRVGAVLFGLWPVLYAFLCPAGLKEMIKESTTYTRDDLRWFTHAIAYFFGRVRNAPPQGRINAGQKLHHLGIMVLWLAVGVSGLVMWFGASRLGPTYLPLVATVHDLCMLGMAVLTVGHIYFTFLYDGLDGMLKGHVSEEYARMEHPKWLAALPESAFIVAQPMPAQPVAQKGEQPVAKTEATRELVSEAKKEAIQAAELAAKMKSKPAPVTEAKNEAPQAVRAATKVESTSETSAKAKRKADRGARPATKTARKRKPVAKADKGVDQAEQKTAKKAGGDAPTGAGSR